VKNSLQQSSKILALGGAGLNRIILKNRQIGRNNEQKPKVVDLYELCTYHVSGSRVLSCDKSLERQPLDGSVLIITEAVVVIRKDVP